MLDVSERKRLKKRTYEAFARRLNDACDAAGLPGYRNGRQSHFKERLGVSAEAARRWFAGESLPRQELLVAMARMLKVDPSWLAYGTATDAPAEPRAREAVDKSAAVNYVAGVLQFAGAAVAFSQRQGDVDLTAIRRGVQLNVAVVQGRLAKGEILFDAPYDHESLFVVGLVQTGPAIRLVRLDSETLDAAEVKNVRRRVQARLVGDKLMVGARELKPITADGIL